MNKYAFGLLLVALTIITPKVGRADDASGCLSTEKSFELQLDCMTEIYEFAQIDMERSLRVALNKAGKSLDFMTAEKRLHTAQNFWQEYQASHCEIVESAIQDKTQAQIQTLQCKIKLTKNRANTLRDLFPQEDNCGCTAYSLDKIGPKKKHVPPAN